MFFYSHQGMVYYKTINYCWSKEYCWFKKLKPSSNRADYVMCWHQTPLFDTSQLYALFTDTVGPGDVGLKEENIDDDRGHGLFGLNQFNRTVRWAQPITYVDVFEGERFTVSPVHPSS